MYRNLIDFVMMLYCFIANCRLNAPLLGLYSENAIKLAALVGGELCKTTMHIETDSVASE